METNTLNRIPGGYNLGYERPYSGPMYQRSRLLEREVSLEERQKEISMAWIKWLQVIRAWCEAERGRKSELARFLRVTRQRLNHWLNEGKTMPGWAVLMLNKYVNFDDFIE